MNVKDLIGWTGRVRVTTTYQDGRVEVEDFMNLITDAGRNLLRDALQGQTDCEIKYLAWGSGTTAPTIADTTLEAEAGRKAITKQTTVSAGVGVTTVYLAPFDANMQIEELGWFAGSGATATADSGVMVARVLWSKDKSSLESVQIDRTDTIA